jgi:TRAP transporter 4TM/12TM fusion protein
VEHPTHRKSSGLDGSKAESLEKKAFVSSRFRPLQGPYKTFVWCFAIAMALWHLFVLGIHPIDPVIFRASHVMFSSCLIFFLFGFRSSSVQNRFSVVDAALAVFSVVIFFYLNWVWDDYVNRIGVVMEPWDIPMAIGIIGIVVEMTRRTTGWSLPIIAGVFLAYQFFGQYAPGLMRHPGYDYERILTTQFSQSGIYDIPTGVSATYVFLFVLFGAFLNISGAGAVFTDVARSIAGGARGGPAKVSVVASGFFGMVSGAAVANVVTTGAFTIPLMKDIGYKPHFAGAVESTASSGGQVMPPVMGASAFVMAEILAMQYSEIMISAIIPALLYYAAVYFMIDFEAVKERLTGLPRAQLPKFFSVLSQEGYQLFPLVVLLYCLLWQQYSVILSALYSILAIIFFTLLKELLGHLYHEPRNEIANLSKVWMGVFLLTMVLIEVRWERFCYPLLGAGLVTTVGKIGRDYHRSLNIKEDVIRDLLRWLRHSWNFFTRSLYQGSTSAMEVASTCACAGIIIGVMKLTGIGLKFTQTILALSQGNLPVALVLVMFISLILGMGVPTVAAYIICSAVAAPALVRLGVHEFAAHMFIFYFAVFSCITPPVCIAAFAAAAIARANVWKVGLTAMKIGFAAYIVPYMFVYGPAILMKGPWHEILLAVCTALLGVLAAAAGFQGFLFRWRLGIPERLFLGVSALALIKPGWKTDLVGLLAFGTALALKFLVSPRPKERPVT